MNERPVISAPPVKRLQQQADEMPCTCVPYRGGTTAARHWSTCPWDSWMDGFLAGVASMGLDVDALPDLKIVDTARRKVVGDD